MLKKYCLLAAASVFTFAAFAQKDSTVGKKERKKDVLLQTSMGDILIRLSDSTPLHRDNFLKLVKVGFYDSVLFHRVINNFMIQGGDPQSKNAGPDEILGNGGLGYRVPAEFRYTLFHKKGVIAAARDGNPEKASSSTQFYLTQGKVFTEAGLDSLIKNRLQGRQIPPEQRAIYTTLGGTPHLDQGYTVYGEVVKGMDVVEKIAAVPTNKPSDRPVADVRIIKAKLVKRKKIKVH